MDDSELRTGASATHAKPLFLQFVFSLKRMFMVAAVATRQLTIAYRSFITGNRSSVRFVGGDQDDCSRSICEERKDNRRLNITMKEI